MAATFPRAMSFRGLDEEGGAVPQCPLQNTHGKKTLRFSGNSSNMNNTMF